MRINKIQLSALLLSSCLFCMIVVIYRMVSNKIHCRFTPYHLPLPTVRLGHRA